MQQQMSVVPPADEDTRAKILFGNAEFKKDLNFTVRYGADYASQRGIEVGFMFPMFDTKEGYLGEAEITHVIACRLKDIPKLVYTNEHDPECRNPIGLYWELMQVYDKVNEAITPETIFTCIGFMVRQ